MADPRFYVKPCPPQYLGRYAASVARQTTDRRDFFAGAGELGNIELLNDLGLGKVGQGLRTLAGISDSVRTGCGALPTSLGSALGGVLDEANSTLTSGVNWVLETMGLNTTMKDVVEAFNPDVANQAWGQAKDIYTKIKNGSFDISQIPGYVQDFQNLERLFNGIYTGPSSGPDSSIAGRCEASPYAIDLVQRHGKYQFLFVVEFHFATPYNELNNLVFPFVIKQSTRPNIRYQMEDVNYYNFRSKAITQTFLDDMKMVFMDDAQNQAMRFYNAYLRATVPLTNIPTPAEWMVNPEERGMDYISTPSTGIGAGPGTSGPIPTEYRTGTVSPLYGPNTKTVLSHIQVYHVFNSGRTANIFRFHNPRITNLNLNDLNMNDGELNDVSCSFTYEGMHIETDVDLSTSPANVAIEQQQANPIYPLRYNDQVRSLIGPNDNGFYGGGDLITTYDECGNEIDTTVPAFNSSNYYNNGVGGVNNVFGGVNQVISTANNAIAGFNNTYTNVTNAVSSGVKLVNNLGNTISNSLNSLANLKW